MAGSMGIMKRKSKSHDRSQRPLTAFESRLYKACQCIPRGKVATYGLLAELLGSSARAVGQGMRHNRYAPVVPCHRVIASDRSVGGFSGSWGEETPNVVRKRGMLVKEGVRIEGGKVSEGSIVSLQVLKEGYNKSGPFQPDVAAAELAAVSSSGDPVQCC